LVDKARRIAAQRDRIFEESSPQVTIKGEDAAFDRFSMIPVVGRMPRRIGVAIIYPETFPKRCLT
jgi:hypothetical protein